MGARYDEILKQFPRYNDEKLRPPVQRVGGKVARSSHRSSRNIVSPISSCSYGHQRLLFLPGGYIYQYRGSDRLPWLRGQTGRATVMRPAMSRRANEIRPTWNIAMQAVAISCRVGAAGSLANDVLGWPSSRSYGRDMELEADRVSAPSTWPAPATIRRR